MNNIKEDVKRVVSEKVISENKTVKKIMPSGTKVSVSDDSILEWRKTGGHAGGKSLTKTVEKAKQMGFEKVDRKDSSTPDGSMISQGDVYKDEAGATLIVNSSYGMTASRNRFTASLYRPNDS